VKVTPNWRKWHPWCEY